MDADAWFVLSALLAPIGYVLQDVVADAMTVEAVPRVDEAGQPIAPETRRLMQTTMQTLGRVAIIGGGVLVAGANVWLFAGAAAMPEAQKVATYVLVYELALVIPVVSIVGVMLAGMIRRRDARRLVARGFSHEQADAMLDSHPGRPPVNWWIFGGGLAFAVVSLSVGLGQGAGGAGDRLRGVDGDRAVPHVEARARARAGRAPHAGRHGARHLRLPGDARAGSGLDVVDDRHPQVRPAVHRDAVADRQRAHPVRPLPLPPLHGRALDRLHRRLPHHRRHDPRAADRRHVLRPARVDGGAHRRRRRRAVHRARRHRARVAARADRDGADARLDRDLRAGQAQGDLLRGDGLVHQPRAVGRRSSARSISTSSSS